VVNNKQLLPVMVISSLMGAGCYSGLEGPLDDDGFRGHVVQGVSLQGVSLQGVSLQGVSLQGVSLQGVSLQGVSLQGVSLQGVSLQGVSLQGTSFSGFTVQDGTKIDREGADLKGTEWKIKVDGKDAYNKPTSETFILRFDDVYADPFYPDEEDMFHYMISYKPQNGQTWSPLCRDLNNNAALAAIPLQNYWDAATGDRIDNDKVISFSCTNAVLAKCVEWGYRPWESTWRCRANNWETPENCDLISLKDYHQACTRMARADYCGNGTPWTVNGTTIDIIDHLYPQLQAQEGQGWQIEAEWGPDGAECLQDIRQQAWKAQGQYPKCEEKKRSKPKSDCGSLKNHRALLVNTFPKPN
jgi:uncharacterized protein YjbI with pentapeptide repeats